VSIQNPISMGKLEARQIDPQGQTPSSQRDLSPSKGEKPRDEIPRATPRMSSDVRLLFQVDPQTSDVTIVVVDRVSRKVIRTIPPEEFDRLSEGELIQMLT